MTKNYQTLVEAFSQALEIDCSDVNSTLSYNNDKRWDSTAHMELVALIEEKFNVLFEMDDIIDMNSFDKAIAILKKCGIDI